MQFIYIFYQVNINKHSSINFAIHKINATRFTAGTINRSCKRGAKDRFAARNNEFITSFNIEMPVKSMVFLQY